jgi:predicted ABC-type ATPase
MTASPTVVLIGGPNGAGKSTLAPVLLRDTAGIVEFVNADTIAHGLSAFRPEAVAFDAGRLMLERLKDLARRGEDFAFESTLATRSYAPWIAGLRDRGYTFRLFFLWLRSPDLAVERVRERVRLGGHDVPEDVIRRRYKAGLRNLHALYRPLADRWWVYDNSEPGEMPLVAAGHSDTVTVGRPDVWRQIGGGDA